MDNLSTAEDHLHYSTMYFNTYCTVFVVHFEHCHCHQTDLLASRFISACKFCWKELHSSITLPITLPIIRYGMEQ